jgi:hypothetical protein
MRYYHALENEKKLIDGVFCCFWPRPKEENGEGFQNFLSPQ